MTRLRVIETRPLELLDLVGTPLPGAGLLDRERSGREVRYRVTPEPLSDAVSWMAGVGGQWDQRLAALKRQFPG